MLRGRGRLFSKSLPLPLSPFKGMWALPHAVFVGSAHTWFFAGSAHTRFFVGAAHTRTRNFLKKVSCVSSKTLKLWIGLDYSIHCRAGACSRRKNKQNLDCLKMRGVEVLAAPKKQTAAPRHRPTSMVVIYTKLVGTGVPDSPKIPKQTK